MKTYIVESQTNYGLMVHIVNAQDKDEAILFAKADGAWDGCNAQDIDLTTTGVVYRASS